MENNNDHINMENNNGHINMENNNGHKKLKARIVISIYENGLQLDVKDELKDERISPTEIVATLEIAKQSYIIDKCLILGKKEDNKE